MTTYHHYNGQSDQKPIQLVLSKEAISALQRKAGAMGMKRNDLIRQVLYNIAFDQEFSRARDWGVPSI